MAAKFQTQRTLGAGGFDIDTAGRGGLTQHQVSHEKTEKNGGFYRDPYPLVN